MFLQKARFHPYLLLCNIPVCVCVCVCVCVWVCVYMVCSSVDGQLGCFYILSIVNNAIIKIGVHISFQISISISLG